jgi:UDP-glucuronate decarboxylase
MDVVSNFIVQALRGEDITIFETVYKHGSICGHLVEGMIRMMNSADGFLGPVNIGNPNEFTMLELAQAVIELTDSNSKIIHLLTSR